MLHSFRINKFKNLTFKADSFYHNFIVEYDPKTIRFYNDQTGECSMIAIENLKIVFKEYSNYSVFSAISLFQDLSYEASKLDNKTLKAIRDIKIFINSLGLKTYSDLCLFKECFNYDQNLREFLLSEQTKEA